MHRVCARDLDVEPILVKAMDPDEGFGWSLDFALRVAEEYKKFLILCKENSEAPIVPSSFVDDLWHLHILDTQKYQEDCQAVFGYFLHHFPYFGMRGEEDEANLKRAWADTCQRYEARFGELPSDLWLASKRCPNCGRRCKDAIGYSMDERPRLSLTT